MKNDKTRITIRIEKDSLLEFRKVFPYRGELTGFLTRCIEEVVNCKSVDLQQIAHRIVGEREEIV